MESQDETNQPLIRSHPENSYGSINTDEDAKSAKEMKDSCFPTRYVVILTAFFAFNLAFIFQANMSVALVKMVNSTHPKYDANKTSQECHYGDDNATSVKGLKELHNQEGEFEWDEELQGMVLSSWFIIYGMGALIGGRLAEKIGTKKILAFSIGTLSVLNLLTPLAANISVYALILMRITEGYLAGMVMPTMNTIVCRWMPKSERSIGCGLLLGATRFGNVLGAFLTGLLCESSLLNGWPLTFYVFGGLGLLWTLVWLLVMSETPSEHPWISKKELEFILNSQGNEKAKKISRMPYRAIMTSVPFWAIVLANLGESWGMSTLPVNFPLYFVHILHYDVALAGLLAAMPPLLQAMLMWTGGIVSDIILKKELVNRSLLRKVMNSIGQLVAAGCLIGATLVGCNRIGNVILLTLTLGLNGFVAAGFRPSLVDIAPDFAGSIMGFTVFVGNSVAFISPYVIGILTNDNQTLMQWHKVFWVCAGFYSFGGLCFLIGGSSELQPWGLAQDETEKSNLNNKQGGVCEIKVNRS